VLSGVDALGLLTGLAVPEHPAFGGLAGDVGQPSSDV